MDECKPLSLAQLASRSTQYATGLASKFEAGAAELLKVGGAHGSCQCLPRLRVACNSTHKDFKM